MINPTLPVPGVRSSARSAYPPTSNGLIEPSSLVYPLAHRLALSTSLPQVGETTTSAHGSLAPGGFCCPSHPRYYDPIRQSRRLPRTSQGRWLYRGSVPDDPVWAAAETFPALPQRSFPPCHHPYAERRNRDTPATSLLPKAFPTKQCVSSSSRPTPAPVGDLLTTLQCSLHATARRVACPPGLVRPGGFLRPPRTCTPELAQGRSPRPRVGYHYTALLGENCDRTCTGWSTAVTGCTFCRKF